MNRKHGIKIFRIIGMVFIGIAFAVLFALIFGRVVQYLWNYLMPGLFGLKTITFWQAFVMVIMSKILFGAFGSFRGGRSYYRHKRRDLADTGIHDSLASGHPYKNWKYYKEFWEEEGKDAFEKYVKRVENRDALEK